MKKRFKIFAKGAVALISLLLSIFSFYSFFSFKTFMDSQYETMLELSNLFKLNGYTDSQINGIFGNMKQYSPLLGEYKIEIYTGLIVVGTLGLIIFGIMVWSITKNKERDYEK